MLIKIKQKLKNKLQLSKNKKNVVKISSGTIIGQIISFVTLPIITRLYGAEIIGLYALLVSIANIIGSFSDVGLINSIMVESDDDLEKNYKVISTLSFLISILASVIITVFYFLFIKNIDMNALIFFIFLFLLTFTLQQIQICYTWLNRNGAYNVLMKNPMINTGIYGFLAVVLGFMGFRIYGYFVAHIVGQIVTLLNMKRNLPRIMFSFKLSNFKRIIKKNMKFVIYQTPTNIIGKFKSQLPILLINSFWGAEILGYYSITLKLLSVPTSLLASAIGRVFFQTSSAKKREGKKLGRFVHNTIKSGMKLGIIPMALLIGFGDVAVIIFLGEEWALAGDFLRLLSLYYYFIFITNTTQGLVITLNKQEYAIVSLIAQIVSYVICFSIGNFIFDSVYIALLLMSVFNIIIKIVYYCFLYRVMEMSWVKYLKLILSNIILMLGLSLTLRGGFIILGIQDFLYNFFNIY
ncbi:oligosaccharide flippase family protein [Natronospora cellulosivora (SeqCode)]